MVRDVQEMARLGTARPGPAQPQSGRLDVDVAIVGGGASGILLAIHLADAAGAARTTDSDQSADRGAPSAPPVPRIAIIDAGPGRPGEGVAYRTSDPQHLLNVRTSGMSAFPDQPDHFETWLRGRGQAVPGTGFARRLDYGAYLRDTLSARATGSPLDPILIAGRVTALTGNDSDGGDNSASTGRRWQLTVDSGLTISATHAVLAIGGYRPDAEWAPESLRRGARFIADPWAACALDRIADDDTVLLVGTGLTMVDLALSLDRPGRLQYAVSRHALMPHPHPDQPPPVYPVDDVPDRVTLAVAKTWLLRRVVHARRRYGDWRPAIDGMRPVTARLWGALTDQDRQSFRRHHVRQWDVHRHRMAPDVARHIAEMRAAQRLILVRGSVESAAEPNERGGQLAIGVREPGGLRTYQVDWVINCTGTADDPRHDADQLLDHLLQTGMVAVDRDKLGLDVDDSGRLRRADGTSHSQLWTLGATRRGQLWESTAIPEIREQAAALARLLATEPEPVGTDHARRRTCVTDLFGQELRTTPAAAAHYNEATRRVLAVQSGAAERLLLAIAEDPQFIMALAALALLHAESGRPEAAHAVLAQAREAARTTTDRETSLLTAVAGRLTAPSGSDRNAALLNHVAAYPREALVLNACVPSIAFAGATEVPEQSWAIVEGLSNVYGSHWWYRGLLAFVRQEQGRWEQARRLAEQALDDEPAAGHAAHALAHVQYETGEHEAGLAWLDRWLRSGGRDACHQAHFSWHAAMYELSLDRPEQLWRRYHSQLAPPMVGGMRAMVDTASLLWRCRIADRPDPAASPLPAGRTADQRFTATTATAGATAGNAAHELLAAVGADLLDRPPTPFAAMHAAFALAYAGDLGRLDRLRHYLGAHDDPACREVAALLVDALLALLNADPATAATLLNSQGRQTWRRLGGSDAQRDIIDDTLITAAIQAQEHALASQLLHHRLDRRPSTIDSKLLASLGPAQAPPTRCSPHVTRQVGMS